jgi:small subunit ribosomal protein S13
MRLVIFGVTLPQNKQVIYSLVTLYGIGLSRSIQICSELGLVRKLKVNQLTEGQQYSIIKKIKEEVIVEGNLEEICKLRLQKYVSNGSQRGYRLRNGLPVRGQRTHSNGNTARKRLQFKKA